LSMVPHPRVRDFVLKTRKNSRMSSTFVEMVSVYIDNKTTFILSDMSRVQKCFQIASEQAQKSNMRSQVIPLN